MDNITHTLTGVVASRVLERRTRPAISRRTIFWLMVICTNLPDIDSVVGLLGDPILSIKYHRSLTHSVLFAPALALIPSGVFSWFGSQRFFPLWSLATAGILIHILFDLVTSFGTQIFAPISSARYSLDWMFIIDPWFTGGLALLLTVGKRIERFRFITAVSGAVGGVVYLAVALLAHSDAKQSVAIHAPAEASISALPQPFSVFRRNGLIQTGQSISQAFFSVGGEEPLQFTEFPQAVDRYVAAALALDEVQWYLTFARHPWIRSYTEGGMHVVELRDLQFSVDERLLQMFDFAERSIPFTMRCVFSSELTLDRMFFDGKEVPR